MSNSACTLADLAETSSAILAHFLFSAVAMSFFSSTFSFSTPTIAACSSAVFLAASTSMEEILRFSSSLETISAVSVSLTTPVSYFSL